MAISIPIISEFADAGVKKAIAQFKQLETTGQKAQFALKKAAIPAAAAVAGLAAAMGDAVKAAAEDQKSQEMLARQLKATTDATDDQIKSVEKYITAQGKNLGITDDQLRPALAGLVRATKNVDEAQRAAGLAMDISAAKGVSLGTVTKALEKAYGGNLSALAKLDPSVRDMVKGGATLEEVFATLKGTFGGAAEAASKTASGGFARLKIAFDETKESVGAALLPLIEKVLPAVLSFAQWAQDHPNAFVGIAAGLAAVAVSILAINAAMALNPITLIAIGIGVLVGLLVVAYKKFDGFKKVVDALFGAMRWWISNVTIPMFKAMFDVFKTVFNAIAGVWNNTVGKLSFEVPSWVPKIGGKKFEVPDIPTVGGGGGSTTSAADLRMIESGAASLGAAGAGAAGTMGAPSAAAAAAAATGGGTAAAPKLTGPDGFVGPGYGEIPIAMLSLDQIDASIGGTQGQTIVNVEVNGGDPQSVVDAIQRWTRQNGPLPIAVTY